MKRTLTLLVSFPLFSLLVVSAQPDAQPQLARALDMIEQGRPNTAVLVLTSITQSTQLAAIDRGRALALLGYAYKEEGQFAPADQAFTRAFVLLDPPADHPADYATALMYYAGLLLAK